MRGFIIIVAFFVLAGCKKEDCGEVDRQMPIIKMSSPSNNQVLSSAQPITVSGIITDNNQLEEVHLEIVNTTSGAFISHEHFTPDGTSYTLNKSFTAKSAAAYRIKVEAKDKKGNIAQTQITITTD